MRGNDVVIQRYEKAGKFGIHSKTETFFGRVWLSFTF